MEKSLKRVNGSKIGTLLIAIFAIAIVLTGLAFVQSSITAGADPAITQAIAVDNLSVHRGQEFDVNVSLTGNANGLYSLRLLVTFDTSAMTLVGYRRGKASEGYALTTASDFITANAAAGYGSFGDEAHPFVLLWNSSDLMKGNGKIVTLTFRSKKNAVVDDRENGAPYQINVACDEKNTRVKVGEDCLLPVSGGTVTTLYGEHYVLLLDENGTDTFVLLENNNDRVTLEDAENVRPGEHPERAADSRFTYTFRGWKESADSLPDHLIYEPTFDAVPVEYTITFNQGIEDDDINYADDRLSTFLGAGYAFDPLHPVTFSYGDIVVFDDYKPVADYTVHPEYTFVGWFEDIFCETPVSFRTMPDHNINLYGCYRLNVESDQTTASAFEVEVSLADGFVFATVSVKENFGVNSFAFTPDFNGEILAFEGFLAKPDGPFVSLGDFLFPAVNAATEVGSATLGVWQNAEGGYDLSSLTFGFVSSSGNVLATGEFVTLKFSVKNGAAAGAQTIGANASASDVTRFKEDGSLWYASSISLPGSFEIRRIVKPVAKNVEYFYNGSNQSFEFEPAIDETYLAVANGQRKFAGTYEGNDAVVVSLRAFNDVYLTWTDETTGNVSFPFVIGKRSVTLPTETTQTYTYTGDPIEYVFGSDGESAYYEVTNGTRTNAGVYSGDDRVCVSLTDLENTVWAGGSSDPVRFTFTIQKQVVTSPVVNAKAYTGSVLTADVSDGELYVVSENEGGTDKGDYPVVFTFKNGVFENYAWADSDDESVTVLFSITDVQNAWTVTPYVADKYYDGRPIETSAAKAQFGGNASVTFRNRAEANAEFSAEAPVNAGIYTAKFFVEGTASYASITETIDFEIFKAELTIPTPTVRTYIYNGQSQTYEFENAGDTEAYEVANGTRTEPGWQFVFVSIKDKNNYVWKDGTSLDKSYRFEIRGISLTAATDTIGVKVTNELGFSLDESLSAADVLGTKAELTALIAGKTAVPAAGQTPDLDAIANKCVFAVIDVSLLLDGVAVDVFNGTYAFELTLPENGRTGFAAAVIDGDDLVVFETQTVEGKVLFSQGAVGRVFLLADHAYTEEIVSDGALKTAADCENAAVYYKSCPCGAIGTEETFSSGEALGHDYDFVNAVWNWSNDRKTATVTVICLRDAAHVGTLDASIAITDHAAPGKETSGFIEYTATVIYGGVSHTSIVTDVIPSTGHVFSADPIWTWSEDGNSFKAIATFVCDCGEIIRNEIAVVTETVSAAKISYHASVLLYGEEFVDDFSVDRPVAIFDFNDGVTPEQSAVLLPGDSVVFPNAPERRNFEFLAWEGNDGSYIVKSENGAFIDYKIGFDQVIFTAKWRPFGSIEVAVKGENGAGIAGALVTLYNGDALVTFGETGADGKAVFQKVLYGNYKLVAEKTYKDDVNKVTSTSSIDLEGVSAKTAVELPGVRFSTFIEGDGSSDGLEDAISDEEKVAISDGTEEGAINEIVITQKRVKDVAASVKDEFASKLLADAINGKLIDFYNVSIVMTVTQRNSLGAPFVKQESITVSNRFQTNVFPISAELRSELMKIGGTADNIFVYKRHVGENGVTLSNLPKVSPAEGEEALTECFFIKIVGGVEYIAVRQREYSELCFGVSPDPVLYTNEITTLTINDWTFGSTASVPYATAKYGTANISFTYSAQENGVYTAAVPVKAGRYFVKASVPASSTYDAAEKITSFTIAKKVVTRPTADNRSFVYNGQAQTYQIAASEDYVVSGATQTNAGTYNVIVTLADADSLVWDTGLSDPLTFSFTIAKKKVSSIEGISFKDKVFHFDGKKHSITVSGDLPEGVTVAYDVWGETEIGKYVVTATFISTDPNYDATDHLTAVMQIRMNWVWIIILLAIVFVLFGTMLFAVEVLIKKMKKSQSEEENSEEGIEEDASEEEAKEEGKNE